MEITRQIKNLFKPLRTPKPLHLVVVIVSLWLLFAYNTPFLTEMWRALGEYSVSVVSLYALIVIWLLVLNVLLISLCSIRFLFKPLIIILFFISTVLLFSNLSGKQYNPSAFNFSEWVEGGGRFLSFKFISMLLGLWVAPSLILLKVKVDWGGLKKEGLNYIFTIVLASLFLFFIYKLIEDAVTPIYKSARMTRSEVIPYHFIDSSNKYIQQIWFSPVLNFTIFDKAPYIDRKSAPKTVLLIISKSIRSDLFNQIVLSEGKQVHSQTTRIEACNTFSDSSLQCMFSLLSAPEYSELKASHQQNLIDLLTLAGVNVFWLSNNQPCGIICQKSDIEERGVTCDQANCLDEQLFANLLTDTLNNLNPAESNLIVIRTKAVGSPLYSKFYPIDYSKYTPECVTLLVRRCSDQALINSYKNALLYLKSMLERAAAQLFAFQSRHSSLEVSLIFTAEFGESLGEKGLYFHGTPKAIAPEEQLTVPIHIVDPRLPNNCLSQTHTNLTYNTIPHSLLGQFHIKSKAYKHSFDIQNLCLN